MAQMPREVVPQPVFNRAVAAGAFGGMALVVIPYVITWLIKTLTSDGAALTTLLHPNYSVSLLLVLPLVQGAIAGMIAGKYQVGLSRYSGIATLVLAADYGLAIVILREGIICLLMALPLYVVIVALGLWAGRLISRMRQSQVVRSSLVPLVVLAVAYDTQLARPEYSGVISDAVTINASPENVWRYVVQHPENTKPPEYWLWSVGMPMPVQSTASSMALGAERHCRFTGNIAFDERITEFEPGKVLTFEVTAQPDHPEILGHFSLDKGQLYLEANPDGTTTVIATSWYRIYVRPAQYFDWWASDVVRNVHFRVLNHIKDLAERDEQSQLAML